MTVFETVSRMPVDAWTLFQYHARSGAFERLAPPWERVEVIDRKGGIREGGTLELRLAFGPFGVRWLARHFDYEPGQGFADTQERGPFRHWTHRHRFEPAGESASLLRDRIEYELPLGGLGQWVGSRAVARKLERTFAFRHRRTRMDLERHQAFREFGNKRILFVGEMTRLTRDAAAYLSVGGHQVFHLAAKGATGSFALNPVFEGDTSYSLESLDVVIHSGCPAHDGRDSISRKAPAPNSSTICEHLNFLERILPALAAPPQRLFWLEIARSALDRFTADPHIEPGRQPRRLGLHHQHSAAVPGHSVPVTSKAESCLADQMENLARLGLPSVRLRTGAVILPSLSYLTNLQLRLESFLFLSDGAKTPNFCWISREDLLGALLFLIFRETLPGEIALISPFPAQRAQLQTLLIQRSFLRYSLNRVLKVLPWAAPGLPAALDPRLQSMASVGDLGFSFQAEQLDHALAIEFGD